MSHDQIQLSTLKGEGELKNLELNEEVLTELLELPSWLRLSGATCNRVAVRIQWTKLKSVPIHLSLDEVSKNSEESPKVRKIPKSTKNSQKFGKYFVKFQLATEWTKQKGCPSNCHYSRVWNKRSPLNKRSPWKICQKE